MENRTTEEAIFEAAYREFMEKGFDNARMQSIADRAGINKALLHYYFRTKDKLFEAVVPRIVSQLPIGISNIIDGPGTFEEKIAAIVGLYLNFLKNNPQVINFILRELLTQPERLARIFGKILHEKGNNLIGRLKDLIENEVRAGNIMPVHPEHFLVNVVSLCFFPFIARFMVENIVLRNTGISFDDFVNQRENEIVSFVLRSLKNSKA